MASDVYEYIDTITEGLAVEYFINAVYNDGCEAASETLIGVCNPTNVNESSSMNAQVFPNPVKGELTVKAEGLQQVVVYNAMGQLVMSQNVFTDATFTMQVGDLDNGIYFVELIGSERTYKSKLVIAR